MPIERVSRTRFKWKSTPWMQPEKVRAIWIFCRDGHLRYEMELTEPVKVSPADPPKNQVPLKDDRIIAEIEQHMLEFDVSGAFGKSLIVGNLEIPVGGGKAKVLMISDLKNWRDWLENKRSFKPRK